MKSSNKYKIYEIEFEAKKLSNPDDEYPGTLILYSAGRDYSFGT